MAEAILTRKTERLARGRYRVASARSTMPGQPACAHWGMDDPSEYPGSEQERIFKDTCRFLARTTA